MVKPDGVGTEADVADLRRFTFGNDACQFAGPSAGGNIEVAYRRLQTAARAPQSYQASARFLSRVRRGWLVR